MGGHRITKPAHSFPVVEGNALPGCHTSSRAGYSERREGECARRRGQKDWRVEGWPQSRAGGSTQTFPGGACRAGTYLATMLRGFTRPGFAGMHDPQITDSPGPSISLFARTWLSLSTSLVPTSSTASPLQFLIQEGAHPAPALNAFKSQPAACL